MLSPGLKEDVQVVIKQLTDNKTLSATSLKRLSILLNLIDTQGYINYAKAYAQLFPKSINNPVEKEKADKAFSKFRKTLSTITEEHENPLILRVDDNKNSDNISRHLWFECEDNLQQRVQAFNDSSMTLLEPVEEQMVVIGNKISYLLVYAEIEKEQAHQLHDALNIELVSRGYNWDVLDYHDIPIGEDIENVRKQYYINANYILLLLSPQLIVELIEEPEPIKKGLPLMLLAFKAIEKKQLVSIGLEKHRFFTDSEDKSWAERGKKKSDWVAKASKSIINKLQNSQEHIISRLERLNPGFDEASNEHYIEQSFENKKAAIPYLLNWLTTPNRQVFCAIFGELGMGKTTLCQRLTQELLVQRKHNPKLPFPVYFDLRTVNKLQWDWGNQGVPPLDKIIDHALNTVYNQAVGVPSISIDDIKRLAQQQGGLVIFDGLDEVMNRLTSDQSNAFIQQLWSILPPSVFNTQTANNKQQHGRLIMTCRSHYFQTLQDQLNALTGQQRESVKQKNYGWVTLLPLTDQQVENYFRQVFADNPAQAERVISMLDTVHNLRELSSRPYNMSLIQQQVDTLEALHRQHKKVIVADLYEGMVGQWLQRDKPKHRLSLDHKLVLMESLALLLWHGKETQIKYTDLDDWLTDQLLENKRWQLVYKPYLDREQGLAILQQDLHNASFLVRQGEDSFRFAHTSIMEFFLARALYSALVDNQLTQWAVPLPSIETLDFLGELIARDKTEVCLKQMATIRQNYQPLASELLLNYALRAYAKNYPGAVFTKFDLSGAQLKSLQIKLQDNKPLIWTEANFSNADLRDSEFVGVNFSQSCFVESRLDRCVFDSCYLDKVNGKKASLIGTIFHFCTADGADFSDAELYRTQWIVKPSLSTVENFLIKGLEGEVPQIFVGQHALDSQQSKKISFKAHANAITVIAYTQGGQCLVSASDDNTLKLWNPKVGECIQTLIGHDGRVLAIAIAPDGQTLASASVDMTVKLWNLMTGECIQTLKGHDQLVSSIAFALDGKYLASAAIDGAVKLWNPETGECLQNFIERNYRILAISFTLSESPLVLVRDALLKLWSPLRNIYIQILTNDRSGMPATGSFSPDGEHLAMVFDDWIRLCNPEGCNDLVDDDYSHPAIAFASDGKRLLSSGGKAIKLLKTDTGECIQTITEFAQPMTAVDFSPDGQQLALASNENTLNFWTPETEECIQTLTGHDYSLTAISYSPDGQCLAVAGHDGIVNLWDIKTGKCIQNLNTHDEWVTGITFAPDGQRLASSSRDQSIKLWDLETGKCRLKLIGHTNWVTAIVFTSNGQCLASASHDNSIKLWDPETGECLKTLIGHSFGVTAIAFAPDGQSLGSASRDMTIKLWNLETGECMQTLTGHDSGVTAIAFAPDGVTLASASTDKAIKLWSLKKGVCLQTLMGHGTTVTAVTFSPDGQCLASTDWHKTIKLWNSKTGECLETQIGHNSSIIAVVFSPDGLNLATASLDGSCILWDYNLSDLLQENKPKLNPALKLENLPESNWVAWANSNQQSRPFDNQHWLHTSNDAWRWLGWNAPAPDGKSITRYPMDYFFEEA